MIRFDDLSLARAGRPLFSHASLIINPGERVALIGANGSGKSSLLALLRGDLAPEQGNVDLPRLRIAWLAQHAPRASIGPVRFVMNADAALVAAEQAIQQAEARHDGEALGEAYARWVDAGGPSAEARAAELLDGLGFGQAQLARTVDELSGGWKMRLNLACVLMAPSDLLLLDEPTNHLDAESVDWLEQFLQKFTGTVVAVTHDRYFLDNAAEWILELDRGSGIPWRGNYSSWLDQKSNRLKQEEAAESARQKALKKELEWVRQNAKGRQAKSKARLARFDELSSYEYQRRNETQEIFIPVAERLGDQVIEFQNVSKAYGDRLLIDNLSFQIPPGAIVGIIGPNGAGKSTIFRMITGREKPDSGEIKIGHTVHIAYVDQSRESLQGDKTVWEDVSGGLDIMNVGKFEMQSRAYIGRFNFKGPDQQKLVGQLSGGERGRLHLAKTLLEGGNVLLLDEPSNDLDVETLRALEDALLEFAGCCLVISHDRWFLDRIATHILAAEGDSQWTFFAGNYREYEEDKRRRLGDEEARPKRFRYKSIHV